MDEAGFATAHLVGNSLGGYVALQLAARGRARSVVAFAPAGGWMPGEDWVREMLAGFTTAQAQARAAAPHAAVITATAEGRRRATRSIVADPGHIPTELIAHQMLGVTLCAVGRMIDYALREGYRLDAGPSPARCGSWGTRAPSCRGRPRRCATARSGSPWPTGWSWRASATAPNSTPRSRPRS